MSIQEWHWIEYVETGYVNVKILKEIVEIIKSGMNGPDINAAGKIIIK